MEKIRAWLSRRRGCGPRSSIGKAYDSMEVYFAAAVFINAVPFSYDKQNRRYRISFEGWKYKIWFLFMFIGMLAEWAQVTRELIRAKMDDSVKRGDWGMIYFVFISWTLLSACHFTVFRKPNEIVNHMNQTIGLREWFTEYSFTPTSDYKIIRSHIYFSCFQGFFQCFMVAAEGFKNQYLYSNVPPNYRNVVTGGIWAAWAYYRVMTNFLAGYFLIFAGMFHVQTCNEVIAMRERNKLNPAEKLKTYRMLQCLCNRYAEAHSSIFVPQMTLFVTQNLILGIYGTLKFYDNIDIANYMNFPLMSILMCVLAYTFYTTNATVYETTKDEARKIMRTYLANLNVRTVQRETSGARGPRKIILVKDPTIWYTGNVRTAVYETKMIAKASPVIGIPFGSLYKIKRTTVLNLFNFIACNAISTLITYP